MKWMWGKGDKNKNNNKEESKPIEESDDPLTVEKDPIEDILENKKEIGEGEPEIDPEAIESSDEEEIAKKEETIADSHLWDYTGYQIGSLEEIKKNLANFKPYKGPENFRHEDAYKWGGMILKDKTIIKKSRGIGKDIIKQVGKQILSGKLNLTRVSFPIRAMIPKSVLESSIHGTCVFPLFMNKAAETSDFLERFKYIVAGTLSTFIWTNTFLKPLNPIIGETLEAYYQDGTEVYAEQISHHPPISYFLVFGPEKSYQYDGYYCYEAKAGLNSITLLNKGKRKITFKDGQTINFNFPTEYYSGTFFGTTKQESLGIMTFIDVKNKIKAEISIGKQKKVPSDYFNGGIFFNDKKICNIKGTYLGYIDFDEERFWDYKSFIPYKINLKNSLLESDHLKRSDLINLKKGDIDKAQKEKETLEDIQRRDAKLRKDYAKKK